MRPWQLVPLPSRISKHPGKYEHHLSMQDLPWPFHIIWKSIARADGALLKCLNPGCEWLPVLRDRNLADRNDWKVQGHPRPLPPAVLQDLEPRLQMDWSLQPMELKWQTLFPPLIQPACFRHQQKCYQDRWQDSTYLTQGHLRQLLRSCVHSLSSLLLRPHSNFQ